LIFKHAGHEGLDRMGLLTANYAAAALTGGLLIAAGALFVSAMMVRWTAGGGRRFFHPET
jgi:hypothetical protein